MEFRWHEDEDNFRQEVRGFIEAELPADWDQQPPDEGYSEARHAVALRFQQAMAGRQWLTMAWPEEYGGLGASYWQQMVLNEEMGYRRAPSSNMGVSWVGPAVMLYGTDEQKQKHLGAIANAEHDSWWCTLYSEPGAGSDLASLQTRAVEDGDDYVINGQKIWTSGAHRADWGWLAARTDPDAPKHRGMTMFLLDMHAPGVQVQPLINMADGHGFNEVFFEDVRIPKDNVVGEVNRGWYHLAVSLDFERSSIAGFAGSRRSVEELAAFAGEVPRQQRSRSVSLELADRFIEIAVGTNLAYRIVDMQTRDVIANHEASAAKLYSSELSQRIASTGMKLLGSYGGLRDDERAPLGGRLSHSYLSNVAATIGGGTSEIQRNIIATRGLGLPRQ
jgi:alkylation response protein AidB-like acyl-CoA dehydrogenase